MLRHANVRTSFILMRGIDHRDACKNFNNEFLLLIEIGLYFIYFFFIDLNLSIRILNENIDYINEELTIGTLFNLKIFFSIRIYHN